MSRRKRISLAPAGDPGGVEERVEDHDEARRSMSAWIDPQDPAEEFVEQRAFVNSGVGL